MIFGPKYSQATEMESESKNQTNLTQTMHSCLLCKSLETQQKQLSTLNLTICTSAQNKML